VKFRFVACLAVLVIVVIAYLVFLMAKSHIVVKTFNIGKNEIIIFGENRWDVVQEMLCEVRKDGKLFMPLTAITFSDPEAPTIFAIAYTKNENVCVLIATNQQTKLVVLVLDFETGRYWCADTFSDMRWGGDIIGAKKAYEKVKTVYPTLPKLAE
jgi:hypothetical protein